jgi:hypothetical protein
MIYCAYVRHLARDRQTSLAQLLADLAVPDWVSLDYCATGIRESFTRVLLLFGLSDDDYMRVCGTWTVAVGRYYFRTNVFLVCGRTIPDLGIDDTEYRWIRESC